MQLTVAYVKQK